MKIVSIGDTHGSRIWRMVKHEEADKIIFIGDYVDSFDVSPSLMIMELMDIIQFKKDNPDKVILLWGNHDIQYALHRSMDDSQYRCSGYKWQQFYDYHDLFIKNYHLFQMAYQVKNYLWTHAGISEGWFKYRFLKHWDRDNETIAEALNRMFEERVDCIFDIGRDRYGSAQVGGPLWIDKSTLRKKPLKQYHQIVGHSHVDEIHVTTKKDGTSVTIIDCLEFGSKEFHYLEIEDE